MQQLRRFSFFDRSIVERSRYLQSPGDAAGGSNRPRASATTSPPSEAAKDPRAVSAPAVPAGLSPLPASTIVCTAGTDTALWLGDNLGVLHTLDHDFQLKSLKTFDISFVAMHAAPAAGCIVCIGRDNAAEKPGGGKTPVPDVVGSVEDLKSRQGTLKYKCYSTTQVDSKGHPVLLREAGLFSKLPEQVVTSSDINKNFTMLAVGTEGAGVCLFRGDLLREKTCRLRLMKVVRRENDEPINSVRFLASPTDEKSQYMLVCTNSSMTCYAVPLKGEPKSCHTDSIPAVSTLVVDALPSIGTFVVHHGEGLFCVDPEQGKFESNDGQCQILSTHKSYIITVTSGDNASTDHELNSAVSADTYQHSFATSSTKTSHQMLTVYLCYPDLRLIAYSSPMRGVRHVVSAMDTLFIISRGGATENNVLFDLREKSFEDRLSILLRYVRALLYLTRGVRMIVYIEKSDLRALVGLQEVYRLHGDWLYSKNMLDKAVDMYIKTIGCAMQQHTLLFFKCTARLKDDSLLACFLEDPRISKTCSLSVALNECRLNGDIKLACAIASRHGYHDEYLSLLLETKEFSKAVELLKQVDAPAACSLLLKHGSALLEHSASDVLLLLSQFIKDYHTSVDIFIPLFVDAPDLLLLFLSLLSHGVSTASRLVPQYESLCGEARLQEAIEKAREAISTTPSIFGSSPFSSLLELLLRSQRKWNALRQEGVRGVGGLNGLTDKNSNSLAASDGDASSSAPSIFAETLLKTLKSRQMTHEDQYRATLLCTIFGFEEGMVLVGEKRQELQLPLAYFEANNDIPNLLRFCLKNGSKDPTLWTQALSILASQSGTQRQIREVLIHIERHRLLPPLAVLELLQQSQAVTLDAVKDYFLRASDELADQLAHSQELLQSDRAEVSQMAEEVFESERCDFCFLPVELPSVHFRCGHSFHIYCLSSNNNEEKTGGLQAPDLSQVSYCCAICTPQFNAKRLLLSQREAEAGNTDDFFKYLRGSADGFDFILSCFGRGLFPSPLRAIDLLSSNAAGFDSFNLSQGYSTDERKQHFSPQQVQSPLPHAGPFSWDLTAVDGLSVALRQPFIRQQTNR
ncbi:hypothetical protein Emed_000235 [Eimeria media]